MPLHTFRTQNVFSKRGPGDECSFSPKAKKFFSDGVKRFEFERGHYNAWVNWIYFESKTIWSSFQSKKDFVCKKKKWCMCVWWANTFTVISTGDYILVDVDKTSTNPFFFLVARFRETWGLASPCEIFVLSPTPPPQKKKKNKKKKMFFLVFFFFLGGGVI